MATVLEYDFTFLGILQVLSDEIISVVILDFDAVSAVAKPNVECTGVPGTDEEIIDRGFAELPNWMKIPETGAMALGKIKVDKPGILLSVCCIACGVILKIYKKFN